MNETILEAAAAAARDGNLSCVEAHRIAAELDVSPIEVGKAVNRDSDLRFYRCQLGFFGYGSKAEGRSKIVQPAPFVPDEISAALNERAVDGRISCLAIWEVAEAFEYPRLGMGNVVESMGLKVTPCQLACF